PYNPDITAAVKQYRSGQYISSNKEQYFGYIPDGLWFALPFSVKSGSGYSMMIFQIENYLLDYVDLFIIKNSSVIEFQKGGAFGPSVNKHMGYATHDFPVELENGDYIAFYYIRSNEAFVPLKVFNFYSYNKSVTYRDSLFAIFYGIIFAVFLIGLYSYIYIDVNRKYYIYHFLFQIFFILYQLSRDGILNAYLWPGNEYLTHRFYLLATALALIFLQHLIMSFLCLEKQRPRLYIFLKFNILIPMFAILGFLFVPAALLDSYQDFVRLFLIYILFLQLLVTFTGVFSKDRANRIFSIGWMFAIVGILIAALKSKGILPYPYFQFYALSGLLIEGIFFLIAVSLRMGENVKEKNRTEAALKEADQRLLQSRGRPHFLMNTFNMIHSLIESKPKQADKAFRLMIEDFQFFTTKAMVPLIALNEEIDFTKNYISIMNLRFGEKLLIRAEYESIEDGALIPPLSFQPLVENAIKFSVPKATSETELGSRTVDIKFSYMENNLKFEITNSTSLEDTDHFPYGETHNNIISRLVYYFPNSSLSLSIKNKLFTAVLSWTDSR
ncbi:MAG: 7TM diverse intracellular signaling domain-containing protein, partial [Spirochaetota bacterium]|nr:7TM diverse intracellular signaling domain-containing protein [Spirochaetota bacterium]